MKLWLFVLGIAVVIPIVGASDCASSWNDASRLATVECLVDHGTWIIDDSIFVNPPPLGHFHPYDNRAKDFPNGTLDKLRIQGHFYSDKSPVPAVYMAGVYAIWRACGGPSASERPDLFCWLMAIVTSGLSYGIAVICVFELARRMGMTPTQQLMIVAAFSFATLALPYSRSVNNHVMLLGVTAALLLSLDSNVNAVTGTLAGIAYTIDLGAGPVICVGTAGLMLCRALGMRERRIRNQFVISMTAMMPWILLHHGLNHHIGGTWRPANANPEFLAWPGSPFDESTMSGGWRHSSPVAFVAYALDLLVGKKGFWGHNLPLVIALPSLFHWRRISSVVLLCVGWCIGVWLVYAAGSTNYSGACVSIRWFVPLIAPLTYLTMISLRESPRLIRPLAWLVICGAAINLMAWWFGPWHEKMIPGYWLTCCGGIVGAFWIHKRSKPILIVVPLARAA